jgi:type IV secretory pathway VirB2 component (pilin)
MCLIVAGVACDWYCAFKWFSGIYSYWSGPVVRGMVLIVMFCAALAACLGRAKWRQVVQIFFGVSWGLCGLMFIGLEGRWPGQPK